MTAAKVSKEDKKLIDEKPILDSPEIIVDEKTFLGWVTNAHHLSKHPNGIPRLKHKVAIVGFAPSCADVRVYFNDPDWEIWGLNQLYLQFPTMAEKATRWFQIHQRSSYDQAVRDHKHDDWLKAQTNFPIYLDPATWKESGIPMGIPYPRFEIQKTFGDYFTNSISWMISLAVYEHIKYGGLEKLAIYGVDMAQDEEFREQRPSCEWLVGWAQALIGKDNVYIPAKSDLMKTTWIYPFEEGSAEKFRVKLDARIDELSQRAQQIRSQKLQLHDQEMQLIGAKDNALYIKKTWSDVIRSEVPGQVLMNR